MPGSRTSPILRSKTSGSGAGEGAPIDIYGGAAYDPTANVIALVDTLAKSTHDLRLADIKFNDEQHNHIKEIGKIRAEHAETLRISDLDRLDKTRQVDVLAGTASAAALATAVQTLANTADRNAETLRNLVNATAATMAKQTADQALVLSTQTDNLVKDINARIAELQKSQYQGAGKSSVADPILEALSAQVKFLVEAAAKSQGKAAIGDPIQEEMVKELKAMRISFAEGQAKAVVIDPMIANMMAEQKRTNDILAENAGSSKGKDKFLGWILAGAALLFGFVGMLIGVTTFILARR